MFTGIIEDTGRVKSIEKRGAFFNRFNPAYVLYDASEHPSPQIGRASMMISSPAFFHRCTFEPRSAFEPLEP